MRVQVPGGGSGLFKQGEREREKSQRKWGQLMWG